jgi:uncharacterized membrane protein (DUF2068 family)
MKSPAASGLRAIALFEAAKGIVAMIASFVLFSIRNSDLTKVAAGMTNFLRLDPDGWFARRIAEFFGGLNPQYIEVLFVAVLLYAVLRFVEAYGLWRLRAWAQWLGIVSGAIYIPIEIYDIIIRPSWFGAGILILNSAIVAYLFYFRHEQKHDEEIHKSMTEAA